ncbi:uncharacterized protein ASCRUDRAFT_129150 [Ascoidea rubescens DSM 1968]|uniref:Uncharacterized protein n=1 Tax=Ascoidea rubescens DSM 1968 TaxID=1344418 RepID=A0A1D2V8S1_9ASCO|nr:hypothetical protein ASCRUDRAFT_129150 [Ascoidea rubescens DSM 1968]ODV58030.1 hypothetical protein ASCRUDRAFT_129150 [Ascoidea rubescens DSM 1968]
MPVELVLSPVMRPLVCAKAVLFHPHRKSSRYIPRIIELPKDEDLSIFVVKKRFGTGSKVLDVYDTKAEDSTAYGPSDSEKRLYWFVRSRAVKGAYKMYSSDIRNTGPDGEDEPMAAVRAGLRSNVLLIKSACGLPASELGWHVINHRVDAIDSYRIFTLADGYTYQWTTSGKYLERVKNMAEKESEVRERIAEVTVPGSTSGSFGWTLKVDETKISREIALSTALCSVIDQWNTNIAVGGIYYARQQGDVRWKRD